MDDIQFTQHTAQICQSVAVFLFEHEPDEDQLFSSMFRVAQEGETYEELRAAELLVEMEHRYGVKFGKKVRDNFGRRISRMGIPCVHRNTGNFYRIFRIQ